MKILCLFDSVSSVYITCHYDFLRFLSVAGGENLEFSDYASDFSLNSIILASFLLKLINCLHLQGHCALYKRTIAELIWYYITNYSTIWQLKKAKLYHIWMSQKNWKSFTLVPLTQDPSWFCIKILTPQGL